MAKEGAAQAEETEQMIEAEGAPAAGEPGPPGARRPPDAKEMRAVLLGGFGGLNKLRVAKRVMPEARDGELQLRVKAWCAPTGDAGSPGGLGAWRGEPKWFRDAEMGQGESPSGLGAWRGQDGGARVV